MRQLCRCIVLALMVSLLWPIAEQAVSPNTAVAQDSKKKQEFDDVIVVIQRKPFLRKGRLELAPFALFSFNDSLAQQISATVNINYNILEWLYVGVTAGWQDWRFLSTDATGFTGQYDRVIDATDAIPEVSVLNAFAGAVVGFVPFYGKLAIFNSAIVHWDVMIGIGGGLIHTRANGPTGGGVLTIGQHYFLLDWLSLNLDVRGYFYFEELNQTSGLFTQWQAGLGVGFWLPTTFEYESE